MLCTPGINSEEHLSITDSSPESQHLLTCKDNPSGKDISTKMQVDNPVQDQTTKTEVNRYCAGWKFNSAESLGYVCRLFRLWGSPKFQSRPAKGTYRNEKQASRQIYLVCLIFITLFRDLKKFSDSTLTEEQTASQSHFRSC